MDLVAISSSPLDLVDTMLPRPQHAGQPLSLFVRLLVEPNLAAYSVSMTRALQLEFYDPSGTLCLQWTGAATAFAGNADSMEFADDECLHQALLYTQQPRGQVISDFYNLLNRICCTTAWQLRLCCTTRVYAELLQFLSTAGLERALAKHRDNPDVNLNSAHMRAQMCHGEYFPEAMQTVLLDQQLRGVGASLDNLCPREQMQRWFRQEEALRALPLPQF